MRDERDANMVSQFSMGFPRIFYTVDKPCGGNYVNNADLFSCYGDKLEILYSKALVRDWRTSLRRRSIPNLLLDVSRIK